MIKYQKRFSNRMLSRQQSTEYLIPKISPAPSVISLSRFQTPRISEIETPETKKILPNFIIFHIESKVQISTMDAIEDVMHILKFVLIS